MTDKPFSSMKSWWDCFDDVEEDDIDRAIREAVWDAIRKHKENGNPIAVWEDGKVKIIQPEDIVLPEDGKTTM